MMLVKTQDIESVKLLRQLMDSEVKGVLFIMAHLDSNSETSQLSKLKRHVQNNTDLELDEIYLQPLMKEHIAAIIGNVVNLEAHDDNVAALSEFIFKRSNGGIPLLVHEIIKNLQQRNLFNLEFTSTNENDMGGSFDDFQWRWNPEAVRREVNRYVKSGQDSTNMTKLLLQNVKQLSPTEKRILQLAGVLGNQFSLSPIIFGSRQPPLEIISDINRLIELEIVKPASFWSSRLRGTFDDSFFMHLLDKDKLQFCFRSPHYRNCVYLLNSNSVTNTQRLDTLHLWCARVLAEMRKSGDEGSQENNWIKNCPPELSLRILYHYSRNLELPINERENQQVYALSVVAAKYCNSICAYETTYRVYALMEKMNAVKEQQSHSLPKHEFSHGGCLLSETARISYLVEESSGESDLSNRLLELVYRKTNDAFFVFGVKANSLFLKRDYSRVLDSSIEFLKENGNITMPRYPIPSNTRDSLIWLSLRLLLNRHSGKNRRSIMNR